VLFDELVMATGAESLAWPLKLECCGAPLLGVNDGLALELTRTVRVLKVVVLKYVDMVDNILEAAVPIMERLPIFPESVKEFARDALALAKKINTAGELAEKVLPGVEASLMTADVSGLQASTKDVASLTRALQDITLTGKK